MFLLHIFKINSVVYFVRDRMNFPKGTRFKDGVDLETGQKIKIAILPDGEEIKFFTEEDLESI